MSIRDPKRVQTRAGGPQRIVRPGETPGVDDVAVHQMKMEEAMRNNPMVKLVESMRQELHQVAKQNRAITDRLHALMDYLIETGILTANGVLEDGTVDKTAVPTTQGVDFFGALDEVLEANGIPTVSPVNGFDRWLEEHVKMSEATLVINENIHQGIQTMSEALQTVRAFNSEEGRLREISGANIGLPQYLTANPDMLSEDEQMALATEFGLVKIEEGGPGEPEAEQGAEIEGLSSEDGVGAEGEQSN